MMLTLAIFGWALLVAGGCFLGLCLAVGQGFGRPIGPIGKSFCAATIGLGSRLADGQPVLSFGIPWALWTLVGGAIIAVWMRAAG